jgi:hypothetical protein
MFKNTYNWQNISKVYKYNNYLKLINDYINFKLKIV